ncbi:MAG TPA: ScyD/ScyE family protein [Glaciibacter sp.]|nr:ScyD/ScyE family protein [Glaciibacter sp.]
MGIKRAMVFAAVLATLLVPTALAAPATGATHTEDGTHSELLASGLQGTSGSAIGPDGALYVPEAALGEVTRIDPVSGETSTYASGLPKAVMALGGATDVAFIGQTAYVLVTLVGPDAGGDQVNGIYRVDDEDSFTVIADIGEYSRTHPPATQFDLERGLQFALERVPGGFLVSDGHHNRVLMVTLSGVVTEARAFGNIVPTGLESFGNIVLMAQAGPVPHTPETGKIVAFHRNHPAVVTVASGYSLLVDVEFGRCGIYALSQGDSPGDVVAGSPALPNSGELLRVTPNGRFFPVAEGLNLPTSVDFVGDTAFVVNLAGEVWRISGISDSSSHGAGNLCAWASAFGIRGLVGASE